MNRSHGRRLPRYEADRTYEWNYAQRPDPVEIEVPDCPGNWQIAGRPMRSPLGVAAGPLLHGHWILYYASLGFDLLTYKTVRSQVRACYSMPNLRPVRQQRLVQAGCDVRVQSRMRGTWVVSFGMPSQSPDIWRADVRWTRQKLSREKLLSVSVVASVQPGWDMDEVAQDYARCAAWAVESGADLVEINLSCPNVETCDGQLYQQPENASVVAQCVQSAIQPTPLLAKIGYVPDPGQAERLLSALAPHVDGLVMVNGFSARVLEPSGEALFDGQWRGICGKAMRDVSLTQIRQFRLLRDRLGLTTQLIGVGGIFDATDVQAYFEAGATSLQLATAPMVDPFVAIKLRGEQSWNPRSQA